MNEITQDAEKLAGGQQGGQQQGGGLAQDAEKLAGGH